MKKIIIVSTLAALTIGATSCSSPAKIIKTTAYQTRKAVELGGKIALDATDQANTPVGSVASYRQFDERAAQRKHQLRVEKENTKRIKIKNSFWGMLSGQPTETVEQGYAK